MITLVVNGINDKSTAMDYSSFQVEDFVSDEYFIRWVKKPDADNAAFWNAWMSKNPQCAERIREAREIILQLDFKPNTPPEGKFLEVWDKIVKAESNESRTVPFVSRQPASDNKRIRDRRMIRRIAASITLIAIAASVFISVRSRKVEISTAYGESRTVSLPDNSKVTLNSNSKVSYSTSLLSGSSREVFLEGEAYFSVVHKDNDEKFIVHTGELDVEVLGTKFNVNSRRGNTKVILEEGKVRLNVNGNPTKNNMIMAPGEYVEYSPKGELTRKNVDTNNYLEWRNNRLIFVGTSLAEIGQLLEDNYGYKVVFESDSIKYRKFTGSSSAVEIGELLEKLSRVYNLEVKKNGTEVTLKQNKDAPPGEN